MSRNRREHGRIISVETHTRGDALAEDAAAGATSITVEDAGDFDEDGGWLTIGGQVVEFSECDDDTGVILLVDPLTAAAEQGDPVQVWSDLYEEVIDYQQALVELDGEYDNPDPVVAEVAQGLGLLPEGDRGKAGESCTLYRVSDDEWEVVGVGGASIKSVGAAAGARWERDDFYALTADDITTGSATMPLSKRPNDEALTCVLAGVPQQPTEWAINYDAQILTIQLGGWEQADDVLWVHYAYRQGITTGALADVVDPPPESTTPTCEFFSITRVDLTDPTYNGSYYQRLVTVHFSNMPATRTITIVPVITSGSTFAAWALSSQVITPDGSGNAAMSALLNVDTPGVVGDEKNVVGITVQDYASHGNDASPGRTTLPPTGFLGTNDPANARFHFGAKVAEVAASTIDEPTGALNTDL